MRVLFVVPDLCPSTGGPVTTVLGLARALAAAGHEASVAATDFGVNGLPELPGVSVRLFPCRYGPRRWAPKLWGFLQHEVGRCDIVSIHTLWQFPTFAAGIACRRARRRYVMTPHGMLDEWSLSRKRWRKQLYLSIFEERTLRGASGLQATSEGECRKSRLERWNSSVFVVPWGVPRSAYTDLPSAGQFTQRFPTLRGRRLVLFLGRLHPKKQPEVALRAFAEVCSSDSGSALVMAGPGEGRYIAALRQLARQLDVDDQVLFTGPLWGDAVREAYRAAAVFLLPSLQENFGHTVAEAMAAGCPVIVSDRVDLAPAVKAARAGLVTLPTPEGTAEALRVVLADGTLREELGRNGQMLVRQRFTWEDVAGELTAVYEDILTGRRHSRAWQSCS
jgi:glycosyltransferase involved in cell wall biosynthesis